MKITNIEIKEVKSLGNYESRALTIGAVIDEGESEAEAINRLTRAVRWYIGKREAEIDYAKHTLTIARGGDGATDEDKAKSLTFAKKFVAKYETALAEIEGV